MVHFSDADLGNQTYLIPQAEGNRRCTYAKLEDLY